MACFQGTLKAYVSPKGSMTPFEVLTGTLANHITIDGSLSPFERLIGSLATVCPIDVAGPHSLCLDDGTELWYADGEPFDFE